MKNIRLFCVSLECDKNLVGAEKMLGLLDGLGLTFTDDETKADVILTSTCCFIGSTKEEGINTILEMARYREEGRYRVPIVVGYLAQRRKQEILDEIPEMDTILGTTFCEEIVRVLEWVLEEEDSTRIVYFHGPEELPDAKAKHMVTTGGYYVFLEISEGCDRRCTYCIVPYLRGPYRNVPIEELVEEASQLARDGVKKLTLVAQETTLYGRGIYGEKSLPRLLHELGKIPGVRWVRIQYCYPEEITDELIETVRVKEKVYHYLDIPIQYASDRILKHMGRKTSQAELTEWIGSFRRAVPDIALRTTLISGFPGGAESDHEELMDFVNEMGFGHLGVFTYSAEGDTPTYSYSDQVSQELEEERRDELMELQQDTISEHCENMVGQVLTVLIESEVVDEPVYMGKTYMDTPSVDGMIFVSTDTVSRSGQAGNGVELMSDDFVRVKVTGAAKYDLIGRVYDESTQ